MQYQQVINMNLCHDCRQNVATPSFHQCRRCYFASKAKKSNTIQMNCHQVPINLPNVIISSRVNTFSFPTCLICKINPAEYVASSIGYYRCEPCANIASTSFPIQGQPLCQICDKRAWFNVHRQKFAPGCCRSHSITANLRGTYDAR